jgi:hypothetical protein
MNKSKSKAVYTNKWLSRNKQHWKVDEVDGAEVIIITKLDSPKIVFDRVYEINKKRIATRKVAIRNLLLAINETKKTSR